MPLAGRNYELCEQNLKIAPASAGVYALYQNHELIYVGHAQGDLRTIRSCLQDHKAGRSGVCTKSADTYKRETCGDPLALERKLLEEFKRSNGKLPRCNQASAELACASSEPLPPTPRSLAAAPGTSFRSGARSASR